MRTNRLIISGLIINSLAACSSPMDLPQPKGAWVDFEPVNALPAASSRTEKSTPRPVNTAAAVIKQPVPEKTEQLAGELTSFVASGGKNVPLVKAVRTIVPASWTVNLSGEVAQKFKKQVSWEGNDRWPYVLKKAMANVGLIAEINDKRKTVLIKDAHPAVMATAAVTPPAGKLLAGNAAPAAQGVKKESTGKVSAPLIAPAVKPPVSKPPLLKPAPDKPAFKPLPAPALKVWKIEKGSTLKQGFEQWAVKEMCSPGNGKWAIRWESETDYPVDYPLTFTASNFEAATTQLFNLYRRAQVPLFVSGYRQQCLIVISDRK